MFLLIGINNNNFIDIKGKKDNYIKKNIWEYWKTYILLFNWYEHESYINNIKNLYINYLKLIFYNYYYSILFYFLIGNTIIVILK